MHACVHVQACLCMHHLQVDDVRACLSIKKCTDLYKDSVTFYVLYVCVHRIHMHEGGLSDISFTVVAAMSDWPFPALQNQHSSRFQEP